MWTQLSVDEALGLFTSPLRHLQAISMEAPAGKQSFWEALVCVDLKTGQRKWHYQLVHHRYGHGHLFCAILADITVPASRSKLCAADQARLPYVFDRVTGNPYGQLRSGRWSKQYTGRMVFSHTAVSTKPPAYSRKWRVG